jgi:hypothetical protein
MAWAKQPGLPAAGPGLAALYLAISGGPEAVYAPDGEEASRGPPTSSPSSHPGEYGLTLGKLSLFSQLTQSGQHLWVHLGRSRQEGREPREALSCERPSAWQPGTDKGFPLSGRKNTARAARRPCLGETGAQCTLQGTEWEGKRRNNRQNS